MSLNKKDYQLHNRESSQLDMSFYANVPDVWQDAMENAVHEFSPDTAVVQPSEEQQPEFHPHSTHLLLDVEDD